MSKAMSPAWKSHSTPEQVRDLMDAKRDLREAAHIVADCPYCTEGWHEVENGVVRCQCWEQYTNAFEYLRNLDSNFFVEDSMVAFKAPRLLESECVSLSQIRDLRESIERVTKGVA